jgi:hypothetical protein
MLVELIVILLSLSQFSSSRKLSQLAEANGLLHEAAISGYSTVTYYVDWYVLCPLSFRIALTFESKLNTTSIAEPIAIPTIDIVTSSSVNTRLTGTVSVEDNSTTTEHFPSRVSPVHNSSRTPATSAAQDITTSAALIPGEHSIPGCAYMVAFDMGPSAMCELDYCDCGGTVAPLLSSPVSVSGTWTANCDYTTQPATNSCPEHPANMLTMGSINFRPSTSPDIIVESVLSVFPICTTTLGGGEACSDNTASWTIITTTITSS